MSYRADKVRFTGQTDGQTAMALHLRLERPSNLCPCLGQQDITENFQIWYDATSLYINACVVLKMFIFCKADFDDVDETAADLLPSAVVTMCSGVGCGATKFWF